MITLKNRLILKETFRQSNYSHSFGFLLLTIPISLLLALLLLEHMVFPPTCAQWPRFCVFYLGWVTRVSSNSKYWTNPLFDKHWACLVEIQYGKLHLLPAHATHSCCIIFNFDDFLKNSTRMGCIGTWPHLRNYAFQTQSACFQYQDSMVSYCHTYSPITPFMSKTGRRNVAMLPQRKTGIKLSFYLQNNNCLTCIKKEFQNFGWDCISLQPCLIKLSCQFQIISGDGVVVHISTYDGHVPRSNHIGWLERPEVALLSRIPDLTVPISGYGGRSPDTLTMEVFYGTDYL